MPTKPFQAVLFDLDGTLVDTAPDFVLALNKQRRRHGFASLPELEIRNTVSDGARALTTLAFGGQEGDADFESKRQELLDLYFEVVGKHAVLFKGFEEILGELQHRHIPWGIVTNKPRKYSEKLLKRMGLDAQCSVLVCPDELSASKPDPEGLFLASKHLGKAPEACIYLGDHARDIEAGRRAGMYTVAVSFGYIHNPAEISEWNANSVIDEPLELRAIV